MYPPLLENEPTSNYSHLTRNVQKERVNVGFVQKVFPAKPTSTHTNFPPNLSRLQNNPLENNVEPVYLKSEPPQKQSAEK
jgi:hypothetical protein